MKKCKITVMRKASYPDLSEKYENPIEHACDLFEGQIFIAEGWKKPAGLCDSAWESLSPFVLALAHGGENFYGGRMKDPRSAPSVFISKRWTRTPNKVRKNVRRIAFLRKMW